jgi:hypothetical protein
MNAGGEILLFAVTSGRMERTNFCDAFVCHRFSVRPPVRKRISETRIDRVSTALCLSQSHYSGYISPSSPPNSSSLARGIIFQLVSEGWTWIIVSFGTLIAGHGHGAEPNAGDGEPADRNVFHGV